MTEEQVASWISAYEGAWRTPGTAGLARLFTEDASYLQGPFDDPVHGLPAIGIMWESEREGPDEVFSMASDIIAVDGSTAVARIEVRYGRPLRQQFRDLWILRFAAGGRCSAFEEWPFSPAGPPATPGG
jgi:hypothetical protein